MAQTEAALAALDRASELDPRSLVVANNRAYVLLAVGRVADARATCERVLATFLERPAVQRGLKIPG